jgi:hypothetical protein
MNADLYDDPSWGKALAVAHEYLAPPGALVRLVRNSWRGAISSQDFIQTLQVAPIPTAPFIRAAQLNDPSITEIEAAVASLGFKGSASVAAVHFACGAIIAQCSSERMRRTILQHIMDSIEIGYHFGLGASAIGPDTGTLIAFAQSIGPALLAIKCASTPLEAKPILSGVLSQRESLERFECEPYQVSSLALQRLGFGPEFASAAVMALGNLNHEMATSNPLVRDWWAASDWISALMNGRAAPARKSSRTHFPELADFCKSVAELPLHLQMLTAQVENVREKHSEWAWYA